MRPLSFLHLTTFYPPWNFGGDGVGIQRLVTALARRGHPQTVVCDADAYRMLSGGRDPEPEETPENVRVIPLRSRFGPLSELLTQQLGRPVLHRGRLRAIVEEGDFDVVSTHNASLVGGPGIWDFGRGVVLHMAHEHWLVCESHVLWRHGRELCTGRQCLRCVLNHRRPPQPWRYTGLLERKGRQVDRFIAMSEFSRRKHAEFGFPFEMEVLPYFLPDPRPAGAEPAGPDAGERPWDRPYFLFVGRLERIKGLDDVIPLFRGPGDADLLIAGDGEYAEDLREQARGLERVRFLGRVPLDELARYYAHAVSLVVPSVCFETFGIILIEAFQNRTPVIARRIGPFPEIVEAAGAGDLFETQDELGAAMARVLADPELRAERARRAYAAYVERWSESAVVPRYLDIVRDAAARKGDERVLAALSEDPPE